MAGDPGDGTADEDAATLVATTGARYNKEFLQKNIDRSIDFRKEYYKYTLGIATALLAFTVSFPPNLTRTDCPVLIYVAWAGLGLAIIAGVLAHDLWSRFFITWRDHDNRQDPEGGKRVRSRITWWRRKADTIQLLALAIGVACIVAFTAVNLRNVAPKTVKSTNAALHIGMMDKSAPVFF
jgi:hypothetical protein